MGKNSIFTADAQTSLLKIQNLLLLIGGEELVLEEDEVEGSDGDTAVREIEYWFEEAERMAADEREPGRPGGVDQREIEHVHYLAEHHGRVGTAELGHLIGSRCGKQLTVEKTVYDIAERVSTTFFCFFY